MEETCLGSWNVTPDTLVWFGDHQHSEYRSGLQHHDIPQLLQFRIPFGLERLRVFQAFKALFRCVVFVAKLLFRPLQFVFKELTRSGAVTKPFSLCRIQSASTNEVMRRTGNDQSCYVDPFCHGNFYGLEWSHWYVATCAPYISTPASNHLPSICRAVTPWPWPWPLPPDLLIRPAPASCLPVASRHSSRGTWHWAA